MLNRGSEWRRWEPHIHAPGTVLNNQFAGGDAWANYLTALENATPKIEAIGVTDYYVTDTYEEVLRQRTPGRLPNVQLIFPNVEVRLDVAARSGFVNLHLLGNFSWGKDQVFEFGQRLPTNSGESNIAFDEQSVLVRVQHQGVKLTFGLDTGGETTTLERLFAERFAGLVQKTGTKGEKTINQIGSSREIESIVLPQVELQVGNFPAMLKPAYILMNAPDNGCHYGSLGMDLMKQPAKTTIDFESMTLRME